MSEPLFSAARVGKHDEDVTKTFKRLRRRELHSSRTAPAIFAACVVILGILWLAVEIVLRLMSHQPLLLSPDELVNGITKRPLDPLGLWIGVGLLCGGFGLWLLCMAMLPGWNDRRARTSDDVLTIVGDTAIASALAFRMARELGADINNISVELSKRKAVITLTAISGVTYDASSAQREAQRYLDSLNLAPSLKAKVKLGSQRRVA